MKQKLRAGFAPILVLIIIVAALSLVAYMQLKPKPQPQSTTQVISSPISTPTGASHEPTGSAETTNWKIYTNKELGYSIKYPSDKLANCGGPGDKNAFFLFEGSEAQRGCNLGEEHTQFYIQEYSNSHAFYKKSDYENCYSVLEENIVVAGVQAIKYSNIIKNVKAECAIQPVLYAKGNVYIVLSKNGHTYEIFFNENTDKEIKYQILSTFRFID